MLRVRVWDLPVRLLHWLLLVAVAAAWLSTLFREEFHRAAGYAAIAVVAARAAWGFLGGRHARFAEFVRGPTATMAYTTQMLAGRAPRYLGHNPLGAWMVVALLACIAGLGLTGWLYTSTDRFFGEPWLESLHGALAWLLLGLIAVHVAGVAFTSRQHRENLMRAMVDGAKPAPRPGDIA